MAVAFKDVGAVQVGTGNPLTVSYPASKASGDLSIIVEVGGVAAAGTVTGYSTAEVASVGSGGSDVNAVRLAIYYRTLDGSEGSTVDVPRLAVHSRAVILLYTGHDTEAPVTFSPPASQTPASTSSSAGEIAAKTGDANDMFLACYGHDRDSPTETGLTSSNFNGLTGETITTRVNNTSGLSGGSGMIVIEGDPASDSTGPVSHSVTVTSTIWASLLLRINASAASLSAPVGRADGSDFSLALGVSRPIGLAGGANAALALGSASPVGLAEEASGAFALGSSRSVGLVSGSELALSLGAVRPAGIAEESAGAFPLAGARPVALLAETDTALALGLPQSAGLAAEASFAFALGSAKVAGLSPSIDTAIALGSARAAGLVTESAAAIALASARSVGLSYEIDAALLLIPEALQVAVPDHRVSYGSPVSGTSSDSVPETSADAIPATAANDVLTSHSSPAPVRSSA